MDFFCWFGDVFQHNPFDVINVVVGIVAITIAWFIPHKVAVNQIYAGLIAEYRSPVTGGAIASIIYFFIYDCDRSVDNIAEQYRKRYNQEINGKLKRHEPINFSGTLHFQRRLIAQFYWDMAMLRYGCFPRLSKKRLKQFLTKNEVNILNLLLHMGCAATEYTMLDVGSVDPAPEDTIEMNKLIYRLYKETGDSE
jgi:phosphate/sulfate permease